MTTIFLCPKCGKEAEVCIASWVKFIRRFDFPYFTCTECRVVYYEKSRLQKCVSEFKKTDYGAKEVPYKDIYRIAKNHMEDIIKNLEQKMGYKFIRFKKKK